MPTISASKAIIPQSVLKSVNRQAAKILRSLLKQAITAEFESIRQDMIREFLNHPVTVEIENGPHALNTSGTLGGYGNLFSFIGFNSGDKPINPIIDILEKTSIRFSERGILRATIFIPTAQSIFSETPFTDWNEGRSWAKGIESGISGLGSYIKKYDSGRSEGGFQAKEKVGNRTRSDPRAKKSKTKFSSQFKKTKYISALINKYAKEFSSINAQNLKIKTLL
jgi:hypothetical protein